MWNFHFRYFSQKAVQGKKKRKDDDSDVSDTEFDEYLGGLFLHLNTQSRVWRERRNEWMNECLTTPQHEKRIGYWVSDKW